MNSNAVTPKYFSVPKLTAGGFGSLHKRQRGRVCDPRNCSIGVGEGAPGAVDATAFKKPKKILALMRWEARPLEWTHHIGMHMLAQVETGSPSRAGSHSGLYPESPAHAGRVQKTAPSPASTHLFKCGALLNSASPSPSGVKRARKHHVPLACAGRYPGMQPKDPIELRKQVLSKCNQLLIVIRKWHILLSNLVLC